MFVYGRPLNKNTIYLSQNYINVNATIRKNCNVFILFKQFVKTIKKNIYNEIGDQFDNDNEKINFLKLILKINMILFCLIKMMVNGLVTI